MLPRRLKLLILFGSQATSHARPDSDWDVLAVSDTGLSLEERSQVADWVGLKLGAPADKVDVVDASSASPLLQHQAAQEGRLLYGGDFDFLRFKVLAWKRYLDTAKFRRLREKYLQKKLYA